MEIMNKSKDQPDDANGYLEAANVHRKDESADPGDPFALALRDLKRKRAEIDAAIKAILDVRPELRKMFDL
jgi:hypothetical protein